MINSGNTYITEIHYQGYTIKKVYACNGELVWGQDGLKFKGEYYYGEEFTLYCDGDPEITMGDVQIGAPPINNLTAATFYPCAEYLGYEVLGAADRVVRIEMLEGVRSIGEGAFNHSSALTEVIIPDSVTSIGSFSFENCDKLSALTIGSGVTYIGSTAFSGCSSLNNDLDFPNIDRINASAFRNCSKLHSVTLGSGCTRIEENAFTNCTALTSVTVEAITPPTLGNSYVFSNTNNCPIYVPCDSVDLYKSTQYWSSHASRIVGFGCKKWKATYSGGLVTSAECGGSSSIIQNEINLTNLVSVEIGNCVTEIGMYAFSNCRSLTSINIPSGVTYINVGAFSTCTSLTSIDIPSGITSIGQYTFYGCSGLTSITVNAITPPILQDSNAFYNTVCPIYVPSQSVNAYKTEYNWSDYADRIQPIQ